MLSVFLPESLFNLVSDWSDLYNHTAYVGLKLPIILFSLPFRLPRRMRLRLQVTLLYQLTIQHPPVSRIHPRCIFLQRP